MISHLQNLHKQNPSDFHEVTGAGSAGGGGSGVHDDADPTVFPWVTCAFLPLLAPLPLLHAAASPPDSFFFFFPTSRSSPGGRAGPALLGIDVMSD